MLVPFSNTKLIINYEVNESRNLTHEVDIILSIWFKCYICKFW